MSRGASKMPVKSELKQIVTSVNSEELKQIREYVRKKGFKSIYALLKKAVFDFMEKHP